MDEIDKTKFFDRYICIICEKPIESDDDLIPFHHIYKTNNQIHYGFPHKNCSLDPVTKEWLPNLICLVPEWQQSIWSQMFTECRLEEPELIKNFINKKLSYSDKNDEETKA